MNAETLPPLPLGSTPAPTGRSPRTKSPHRRRNRRRRPPARNRRRPMVRPPTQRQPALRLPTTARPSHPARPTGFVAVTNPARNNAPIFICCLEHLYHFHNPGQSYTAPVSSNHPLARHYAFSLQAALRQLRQSPDYDPSLDRQIQSLEGQIKRRLTPNPPPAPGRMSPP